MTSEVNQVFEIIAEEAGLSTDEFTGEAEFAELGIDNFLATLILSRVAEDLGVNLPETTFDIYPTVDSLHNHLCDALKPSTGPNTNGKQPTPKSTSYGPLSLVLQGKSTSSKKILFLLPDGSGSGMAYAMLPRIDPDVCLVALNSPFLRSSKDEKFTVEGIAALWADDIQRRQPQGPYYLGGWSAGGYYSFEVAKILLRNGHKVEKLILIDSPCRLMYEELPMEVVHYLANNNLMGNWGTKQPPAWLVNHFDLAIKAVSTYHPTPIETTAPPDVCIIWAEDGVLDEAGCSRTGLDFNIKVTRMLMQRPDSDGPLGWNMLFPGAKISVWEMPGNHFTIVYPPNCASLSNLLKISLRS